MKLLLPHRFKKIGIIVSPSGLTLWIAMQLGYIKKMSISLLGAPLDQYATSPYHMLDVAAAIIGFICFLGGLYFVAFSKEKIEDEMVQKTRLDSFQFAALIQISLIITGFLMMMFSGDPGQGGMLQFFILLIFTFWLTFIGRFNYILHFQYRQ